MGHGLWAVSYLAVLLDFRILLILSPFAALRAGSAKSLPRAGARGPGLPTSERG